MTPERRDEIRAQLACYPPNRRTVKAEPFVDYTRRLGDEWALPQIDHRSLAEANDTLDFLRGRLHG